MGLRVAFADLRRLVDILADTGLWAAGVAAALATAASLSMQLAPSPHAIALAFWGTLVVYGVDRLGDVARDRATSPARTRFVERWRRPMGGLVLLGGLGAAAAAWPLGVGAWALCACVAIPGLLHRRLKRWLLAKTCYVTAAWLAVVAGLPAVVAGEARHLGWVCAVLGVSIGSNVLVSNLRKAEGAAGLLPPLSLLAVARGAAAAALGVALVGPAAVRPLALIPAALLASLVAYRPGERYGPIFVDGALLVGGLAAALFGWLAKN